MWIQFHHLQDLPASLDDLLLPQTSYTLPELYVIGTEETSASKKEWEVLIQQTIGPSHVLLQSASLGSLHLVLFIHRDLLWYCSGRECALWWYLSSWAGYCLPSLARVYKFSVGPSYSIRIIHCHSKALPFKNLKFDLLAVVSQAAVVNGTDFTDIFYWRRQVRQLCYQAIQSV